MRDEAGLETREYGPLGEVTKQTRTVRPQRPGDAPSTFSLSFAWDSFERLLGMTYPDGEVLACSYDEGDLVTRAVGRSESEAMLQLLHLRMDARRVKLINIYSFHKAFVFVALGETLDGIWIASTCWSVQRDVGDDLLGTAVREALDSSVVGLPGPRPAEWPQIQARILGAAGASSWAVFARGARCVGVQERQGRLRVEPMRNLGKKGGFEPIPSESVLLDAGATPFQTWKAVEALLTADITGVGAR